MSKSSDQMATEHGTEPRFKTVTSGLFGLALAGGLAVLALYASRYWTLRLWDREGLFGIGWLRPNGDVLRQQWNGLLKGSGFGELNAFDVLLWAFAIFAALSVMQWLWNSAAKVLSKG